MEVLVIGLTIFVLAIFVGFEVITKVPPTLHTPLMSGSNAISGITLIGALLAAGSQQTELTTWLGFTAVVMASINVVGGFWVTHRMLSMFRRIRARRAYLENGVGLLKQFFSGAFDLSSFGFIIGVEEASHLTRTGFDPHFKSSLG